MQERPLSDTHEILYQADDMPSPLTMGALLWVALGFLPLPIVLLMHWLLHGMPNWERWCRLLSAYDVLSFVAPLGTAVLAFGAALIILRQRGDAPLIERIQSYADATGLESWQQRLWWVALPTTVILVLMGVAGPVEIALLMAIACGVLTARRLKRFPRTQVDLVPAALASEVEPLRRLQGLEVRYQWRFTPTPESAPELLSLTLAFSPTRLDAARDRPRQRDSENDWLRFLQADRATPEIVALAAGLDELHDKYRWTPFQRCCNVLALLQSFTVDAGAQPRFAIETLHDQQASPQDLAITAYALLRALGETVPHAVLVLRNDGSEAGIGIAGAEELPDSFRGFHHAGSAYLFVRPMMVGEPRALRWVWQPLPHDWGTPRVLHP
ncbi:MAG: hypothetical protein ACUVV1_06570 [Fimbriimonadales bacterium]